jgi:hypothetical protein
LKIPVKIYFEISIRGQLTFGGFLADPRRATICRIMSMFGNYSQNKIIYKAALKNYD